MGQGDGILSQVAATSNLLPVDEQGDDPDFGPPDDSTEITQSEPETNVYRSEVGPSQETSSLEHEPDADAGASDVSAPPPGFPPDGPAQMIPPRPRRRWQFEREQIQEERDAEFYRDRQEFLHLHGFFRDATERLEDEWTHRQFDRQRAHALRTRKSVRS